MAFRRFTPQDFEIFALPEFGTRMAAIRAELRPNLLALGEELAAPLAEMMGGPLHPHAAAHMRRRVNPPEETWVAFARDARGYKRWTHLRVAASQAGVRVVVFVEDDADDKPRFAQALQARPARLLEDLQEPRLLWYTLAPAGEPPPHSRGLRQGDLLELGRTLEKTRTAKFQAGIPLGRDGVACSAPADFRAAVLTAAQALKPLYLAGIEG
jgi:uncharacterized protein YktB (UPF0637 family)